MAVKSITLGDILKFTLLPGILPRARTLFGTGFGSFAFFIAMIYRAVRLLPAGHPFLDPANIGRYGVASVIAEAGRHIYHNRFHLGQKNLDQIVVFLVVLAAIVLLALQLVTLLLALFMPQAMAYAFPNGPSFSSPFAMFGTPEIPSGAQLAGEQPFYDIAFMFLDRVFGVPGVFNSCIADSAANSCVGMNPMGAADNSVSVNDPGTFPWPYHHALHGIFQFYSVGMLVVAVFLLVYYTIVVVAETAQTGTPFGKRFNTLWAPLRLVLAAGLLIPISYGLNAGQYTVLYAAKWGSNFATNGWIGFNQMISSGNKEATALGASTSLIATPKTPDVTQLLHFFSIYQACKLMEDTLLLPRTNTIAGETTKTSPAIHAYLVRSSNSTSNNASQANYLRIDDDTSNGPPTSALSYESAVRWSGMGDVVIRFGVQDDAYGDQLGTVKPFCGEVTLRTVVAPQTSADAVTNGEMSFLHLGGATVMGYYWDMLVNLITVDSDGEKYQFGPGNTAAPNKNLYSGIASPYTQLYAYGEKPSATLTSPDFQLRNDILTYFNTQLKAIIADGVTKEQGNTTTPFAMRGDFLVRGWAAAGVWYNRIAEVNGTMTTAAWNLPVVTHLPLTMETVAQKKQAVEPNGTPDQIYNPYIQNQRMAILFSRGSFEEAAADTYWQITKWWQEGAGGFNNGSTRGQKAGNAIIDLINWLFGTSGLFSIRENSNVHPLAQLSSIGKSLIERSITLMGVGLAATAIEPWAPQMFGLKQAAGAFSGMIFSMLSLGASAGFILFYVIPFLPFIYFFFAVAGWVKAIFEAMVGVPLWALAHIKIDGNSLPGDAAMAGYYMIVEIMLRPILIIFGLVSSVTIYAASVQVLNDVFNLAVQNITGVDIDSTMNNSTVSIDNLRGSIDTFLYTIMYTIIVYMLGMSSFKMIDLIPGAMMRWMGANISPFTDSGEGPAGNLVQYGTFGSGMIFKDLGQAGRQTIGGLSQIAKGGADMMMRGGK